MRIGLLIYGSLNTISGGYLYDRKLVETLQGQGDEVELISLAAGSYERHLSDNLSIDLGRRLKALRAQVLLQDELNHPSLFWMNRRLKNQLPYPLISIVHHLRSKEYRPTWQNAIYRVIESAYLRSVDGFIYNSHASRQAVEAAVGQEPRRWRVIYPAGDRFNPDISEAEIRGRASETGPLRVLFIGNVTRRKSLHVLIDALALRAEKDCHLTVVGNLQVEPTYVQEVHRQVRKEGLADRVTWMGPVDDAKLAGLLRTHQVLVVPSSFEGYGIVYLEGMSFGLPAIGTTAGGAGEIITHRQDGFLIEPGDAGCLAELLRSLQLDQAMLVRMSLAARQRYLAQPTWAQTGQAARNFLVEMVKE